MKSKGTKDRSKPEYWVNFMSDAIRHDGYWDEPGRFVDKVMHLKTIYELRVVYWRNVFKMHRLSKLAQKKTSYCSILDFARQKVR